MPRCNLVLLQLVFRLKNFRMSRTKALATLGGNSNCLRNTVSNINGTNEHQRGQHPAHMHEALMA